MDRDRLGKDGQVERYLKGAERERTRRQNEKNRNLRGGEREDREHRGHRTRGHEQWDEEDDDAPTFQRIRKPTSAPTGRRAGLPEADEADCLVVGVESGKVLVELHGEVVEARMLPEFVVRGAVTVGDLVALEETRGGSPRVIAIAPRRNALTRTDPANPHEERVIAANLDLAVIVLAPHEGGVREGMADRIRVALAPHGVEDLLVVNKVDLLADGERTALEARIAAHAENGREAIAVSAHSGEGVDQLRSALADRTVVFVGPSGVGKSTLLNLLDPSVQRPTGEVREKDGKGRHTTTSSRLVRLAGGTRLIDTPGVRQFGLGPLDLDDLRVAFPELVVRATDCRYSDCRHLGEEGCALEAAAKSDVHLAERLGAWRRILESDG
ncbi:MAG: ribosome small subunit-dependent GTPase A [Planctomycetes bacterium]|nr:ribosome small subunit-dependent GTPase A [Planctomycetota bacterium]MCB9903857.1 ribosome small subunit-dependent GTPase A [Planctomycetota bacterium]